MTTSTSPTGYPVHVDTELDHGLSLNGCFEEVLAGRVPAPLVFEIGPSRS